MLGSAWLFSGESGYVVHEKKRIMLSINMVFLPISASEWVFDADQLTMVDRSYCGQHF